MAQLINFRKEREFGDHFNDAFGFLKQEFKPLGKVVLYYVVPFMLLYAISMTVYSLKSQELIRNMGVEAGSSPFGAFAQMGNVFGYLGLALLFSLVSSTMMVTTVFGYIKVYARQNGVVSPGDVWAEISANFIRCFFAMFLVGIITFFGLIFCVIPGIYLGVSLCLVPVIVCLEETNIGEAFSRSMKLTGANWWGTFGVLFITFIITYILILLVSIPGMLFGIKSVFTSMKQSGDPLNFSVSYYIVNAVTQLLTQLMSIIFVVVVAFIYFSLVEKVEKPSLLEKIGQIKADE